MRKVGVVGGCDIISSSKRSKRPLRLTSSDEGTGDCKATAKQNTMTDASMLDIVVPVMKYSQGWIK